MRKIKKQFHVKIISLAISILFLFTSTASTCPLPSNTLRVPIGNYENIIKKMQSKSKQAKVEIFNLLCANNWLTVEEINRNTGLSKTIVQESLDFLLSAGVVIEKNEHIYKINPILENLSLVNKTQSVLKDSRRHNEDKLKQDIKNLIPIQELVKRLALHKYPGEYIYNTELAIHAVNTLGNRKEKEAIGPLIDLLDQAFRGEWYSLVISTVRALGKIGAKEAKYPLGRLLQNKRPEYRATAREALLQIDSQFYYDLQKKTILSVLSAKELELLIQRLGGGDYDTQAFDRLHSKLDKVYAFDTVYVVVNKTGGIKAWKEAPKEKRKNLVSEIKEDYDEYEHSVSRKPGIKIALRSIFGKAVPADIINKKSKVLLLGIGEGITANLAVQQGIKTIVGLDISAKMLKLAENNLEKLEKDVDIRLIEGDMFDIGELFKNEKFPIITLSNVLIFYPYDDRKYVLSETLKLLEEGGYIAICYRSADEEHHAKRNECLMQPEDYVGLLKEELGFDDAGYYIGAVERDEDSSSDVSTGPKEETILSHTYIVWGRKKLKGKLKSRIGSQLIGNIKNLKRHL
ncbi:MAG: methyltransferase domain-containing protein [Candidatus Gorgyraea atricola]|nr:methyltransferase domain-containing protein [Candidatus Gorgyraea atricola]